MKSNLVGENVTGLSRYIIHFYCLAVEASFYSNVVEYLPVDPATWVRFLAGAGKIFSLYDICYNRPNRERQCQHNSINTAYF